MVSTVGGEEAIAADPLKCRVFLPILRVLAKEVPDWDEVSPSYLAVTSSAYE